jgi:ADP-ribosylglycohydrolase
MTRAFEPNLDELSALFESRRTDADLPARYRGTLLGVAAGNALGLPAEGMSRRAIAARFPSGLAAVDAAERTAPWDDDLAQTVVLAEALLEHPDLDLEDLARRLLRWARDNGRGMGGLTAQVLERLAAGTPAAAAARLVWEADAGQPAGNGAVMRCAPVALRWRRSGRRLVETARKSAVVTHWDPRCVWSVVCVVGVIALCLDGRPVDVESLARAFERAGAPAAVVAAIGQADGARLDDLALDDRARMGYTLKAMQVALWAARQEADFAAPLVAVVNAGGDTDTNGAVAGAVLGARAGAAAIPRAWLDNIRGVAEIERLAERLYRASLAEPGGGPA